MKITCTKHEFADLVRNCDNGYCSQCALRNVCITVDCGHEVSDENTKTVEHFVTEIIMEDETA